MVLSRVLLANTFENGIHKQEKTDTKEQKKSLGSMISILHNSSEIGQQFKISEFNVIPGANAGLDLSKDKVISVNDSQHYTTDKVVRVGCNGHTAYCQDVLLVEKIDLVRKIVTLGI